MKCFIGKIVVIFIWVVFFVHLININTNGKDDFYVRYTNVEIVEKVDKDHIIWQGTNPNSEVESFIIEYCACGNHFENTCGYTIEELTTGTVTRHRCGKVGLYVCIPLVFLFITGIPFMTDEGLEWDEKENIIRNCLTFCGYNKEKINKSLNIVRNMKIKNPFGFSYKFDCTLGELFKTTLNEYNKLT